eukprot:5264089-Amphidinium_carterae.1
MYLALDLKLDSFRHRHRSFGRGIVQAGPNRANNRTRGVVRPCRLTWVKQPLANTSDWICVISITCTAATSTAERTKPTAPLAPRGCRARSVDKGGRCINQRQAKRFNIDKLPQKPTTSAAGNVAW